MSETGDQGDAEFYALTRKLRISPMTLVDPRTGYLHATGRRRCRQCTAKELCRQALRQPAVTLAAIQPFCPNADLLFELADSGLPRS